MIDLLEKAEALLNSDKRTEDAKRTIARLVENRRKKGVWIPKPKSQKDLPEVPTGSIKVEMVSEETLRLGEAFKVTFDGLVTVPESVDGQFIVERHIIQARSRSMSMSLGRSKRPERIRGSLTRMVRKPGDYNVLCILAVRTIKDAKAQVLDVAELSYTVVAEE